MNSDTSQPAADWAPPGIDVTTPSVARIYDYLLGGKDNYAPDRETAQQITDFLPEAGQLARTNRVFLQRVVRLCADNGITQFLDLGTGIPTEPAVHHVAQAINPDARVVYIDNDPVALAHARALLEDTGAGERVRVVDADMRRPTEIVQHPLVNEAIDWDQPVAVLLLLMLHFVADHENPTGIVDAFHRAAAPGSCIAVTHASGDGIDHDTLQRTEEVYNNASSQMTLRPRQQIHDMLDGLHLWEPGLVFLRDWRPGDPPKNPPEARSAANILYAAVGEVP